MRTELTAERARELLDYRPETGEFFWRVARPGTYAGASAGHWQKEKSGEVRLLIRIDWTAFLAHRVGWLIVHGQFPLGRLDHKDGDQTNNKILNLRPATHSQNMQNKKKAAHNKSGFKGVSWDPLNNKWVVRIRVPDGEYRNLGRFTDAEAGHQAYCAAAKTLYGEFARFA